MNCYKDKGTGIAEEIMRWQRSKIDDLKIFIYYYCGTQIISGQATC